MPRFISARLLDWWLLATTGVAAATGFASLLAGRPSEAWIVVLHGMAGLLLVGLLAAKLARVYRRVVRSVGPRRERSISILATAAAVGALITGVLWVFGVDVRVWQWSGLTVHALLGVVLVPLLLVHLRHRFRWSHRPTFADRRTAIHSTVLLLGGIVAWRLQRAVIAGLGATGAARRFTGSIDRTWGRGNAFPVTSWVADDPDPVDPDDWRLRIDGAVGTPATLAVEDLAAYDDAVTATLDCTGGWYASRRWSGVRVGRLLAAETTDPEARWVRFESITGYRWSLPLAEAESALLATTVDDEPLSHGHGFPARLVAPGRRGFQWVKWVERIEVRRTPDYGQWLAIFTSGFR